VVIAQYTWKIMPNILARITIRTDLIKFMKKQVVKWQRVHFTIIKRIVKCLLIRELCNLRYKSPNLPHESSQDTVNLEISNQPLIPYTITNHSLYLTGKKNHKWPVNNNHQFNKTTFIKSKNNKVLNSMANRSKVHDNGLNNQERVRRTSNQSILINFKS
jgi:hypothetical protein